MSKKNHKRKTSKTLTKQNKVLQDPSVQKLTQQTNRSSQYNNQLKKKS